MKKTLIGLLTAIISLSASAQIHSVQVNLNQNAYKGKLGISNLQNPSDNQLKELGKRVSSIPMPTKAATMSMMKKAMAQRPSMAKALKGGNIANSFSTANYTPADTVYSEGWESWDAKTFSWVPAAWKRFVNFNEETYISEADGRCPTWMAFETDGYYLPYATEGRYVMMCMFGEEVMGQDGKTVLAPAPEQDEWIVSPVVNNVQKTNYLIFDLAYSPIYTHAFTELVDTTYKTVFDLNRVAYDVEVLITTSTRTSTNNEENYTKVFKLSDAVDELLNSIDIEDEKNAALLNNMRWNHFKISLADYADKNIRVAFRYKGSKGGVVMLDAVRVSDMLPVAKFDRPEGSFYMGFSDDARLNYSKNVLMPAYVPTQWTNYSNNDSEAFVWTYKINDSSAQSTDVNLTMPGVSPTLVEWPTLQANAGVRADQYNGGSDINVNGQVVHSASGIAKVGGDANFTYEGGLSINFGLGNFDPTKLYWSGEVSQSGTDHIYAFGTGSGPFWSDLTDHKYNAVTGIANVYDQPASPYVFNKVMMPLSDFFNMGANIVCTIYKAQELENGGLLVTDEVLGQTTATDAPAIMRDGKVGGYIMNFEFPNLMVVDTPICIEVSGFDNQNLLDLAPVTQALNHDSNKGYSFVLLKNQETGNTWWCEIAGALSALEGPGNMEVSHCFGMNAVFPYLHSNKGDVIDVLTVGEQISVDIDSYWYPKKSSATDQMNGWEISCDANWLTVEPTINDKEQKAGIDVKAEALPEGIEGRVATVTIKALACEETITFVQGTVAGIATPTIDGFATAKGTYNISGQRVNRNTNSRGLYIENRGGKFVKVLR